MKPVLRKIALTAHIAASVGWLGAILPYLALAIAGLVTPDAPTARSAYLAMSLIGWSVLVPLSFAALISGLVQSLGTAWGLFRHWWIVAKLALTTASVFILLAHMPAVDRMARIAAEATQLGPEFRALRIQLVVHPAGGLLVLLAITALSVFKPWGTITPARRGAVPEGLPPRVEDRALTREFPVLGAPPRLGRIIGFHVAGLAVALILLHIVTGGVGHHGH